MAQNKNRANQQPRQVSSPTDFPPGQAPSGGERTGSQQGEGSRQQTGSANRDDKRRRRGNAGGDKRHGGNR